MPRLMGSGPGPSKPIPIRLGEEELAFYKRKANEAGRPLATYLALLLKEGVIAESAAEIEERLRRVVTDAAALMSRPASMAIPEELLMSIFLSEALLTKIVEQRNPQELYDAQSTAKRKAASIKGDKHGRT